PNPTELKGAPKLEPVCGLALVEAAHGLGVERQGLVWHDHPTTQEARHMEEEVGAVRMDLLPCPTPANSLPSNRRLAACWTAIPIPRLRSSSACGSKGLTIAIPWSKPIPAPSAPADSPPFSPWPLPRASVPRSIGACLAPSRWGKLNDG